MCGRRGGPRNDPAHRGRSADRQATPCRGLRGPRLRGASLQGRPVPPDGPATGLIAGLHRTSRQEAPRDHLQEHAACPAALLQDVQPGRLEGCPKVVVQSAAAEGPRPCRGEARLRRGDAGVVGARMLQEAQGAARPEDAAAFPQCRRHVVHRAEHERPDHGVERGVRIGQGGGIARCQGDRSAKAGRTLPGHGQGVLARVDGVEVGVRRVGRQVESRTDPDLQHVAPCPREQSLPSAPEPGPIGDAHRPVVEARGRRIPDLCARAGTTLRQEAVPREVRQLHQDARGLQLPAVARREVGGRTGGARTPDGQRLPVRIGGCIGRAEARRVVHREAGGTAPALVDAGAGTAAVDGGDAQHRRLARRGRDSTGEQVRRHEVRHPPHQHRQPLPKRGRGDHRTPDAHGRPSWTRPRRAVMRVAMPSSTTLSGSRSVPRMSRTPTRPA